MRVDILCSGSKGNCTLIRSGDTSIMLDCGPSSLRYIKQAMEKVGGKMEDLQAMLVTHTHSDHIRQLRHFAWLPIYAYCTPCVRDLKKNPVPLTIHHVTPMLPFTIGSMTITPFALSHDAGPTVGFVFEDGSERLVYYTDTGYLRNELFPFLRGADYYIAESNHDVDMLMNTSRPWSLKQRILSDTGHLNNFDSSQILRHLITDNTKEVVLAHLSEEANTPDLAVECFFKVMLHYNQSMEHFHLACARQNRITSFGTWEGKEVGTPVPSEYEPILQNVKKEITPNVQEGLDFRAAISEKAEKTKYSETSGAVEHPDSLDDRTEPLPTSASDSKKGGSVKATVNSEEIPFSALDELCLNQSGENFDEKKVEKKSGKNGPSSSSEDTWEAFTNPVTLFDLEDEQAQETELEFVDPLF